LIFLEGRGSLTTVRNFRLFPVVSLSLPKLLLYFFFFVFYFCPLIFLFLILVGLHQSLDPTSRAKSITLENSPFGWLWFCSPPLGSLDQCPERFWA
jgi:hypothetical protein